MRRIRNPEDGRVHFSQLKQFSRSPAHYVVACERPFESTAAMRVGTTAHRIILGARPGHGLVIWDAERRDGKAYAEFKAQHAGVEIITRPELLKAQAIADAAIANPFIAALTEGARCEVPLTWSDAGIECATSGVDIVSADGLTIADLKTTNTTEPRLWQAHALSLSYHAQLAWYDAGCRANGIIPTRHFVIGIEATPPYSVVPLDITPALLAEGRKSITKWLEALRVAESNDFWPTYVDGPVTWDVPPWMAGSEDVADGFALDDEEGAAA